jgi:conjugative transfer pilus assembly protein TraH
MKFPVHIRSRAVAAGVAIALLVGLGSVPPTAQAGIDSAMQQQFDTMVNATPPSAASSAQQGLLSGGSMVIRNNVMQLQPFGFTFPSMRGGCGGWDLFGGSFSFISSQQLVAFARSIVSNAITYAFYLALDTISHDLAAQLKSFQQEMNAINAGFLNSCKVAESLDNSILGLGSSGSNQAGANQQSDSGQSSDNLSATQQGGPLSAALVANQNTGGNNVAIVPGNQVWNALQQASQAGGFSNSGVNFDTDFQQALMSVSGTVVICDPTADSCTPNQIDQNPDAQKNVVRKVYGPIMKLADLIDGSFAGRQINIYQCDDTTACLTPKNTPLASFIGIRQYMVMQLLQGTCGDPFTTGCGILGRYAQVTNDMSSKDLSTIALLGPFATEILKESREDETGARSHAMIVIPLLAADLAEKVASDAIQAEAATMSTMAGKIDKDAVAAVSKAADNIKLEHAAYVTAASADLAVYNHLAAVRSAITGAGPKMPVGITTSGGSSQ